MRRRCAALAALAAVALAGVAPASGGEIPRSERRSGYDFMSRETRAMQDDDSANPGFLWALEGEGLWNRKAGAAARSCADCHGDARSSMKGVAARHPSFDPARGRPISLEQRVKKTLVREHLSSFVVTTISGNDKRPTLLWHVDAARRRELERTRLGRRVLCSDRHNWSTGRIVHAFRGQWNVEELFRRSKKGGVVPWGPSHQWADGSLRLHTFATVLGLMLVSLAKIALGTNASARQTIQNLAEIKATLVRTTTGGAGRRPTVMLAPELTTEQRRAVRLFELERWFTTLLSCMTARPVHP